MKRCTRHAAGVFMCGLMAITNGWAPASAETRKVEATVAYRAEERPFWRRPLRIHLRYTDVADFHTYHRNLDDLPPIEGTTWTKSNWPLAYFKRPFYAGYITVGKDGTLRYVSPLNPFWRSVKREIDKINRNGFVRLWRQRPQGGGGIVIGARIRPCYRDPDPLPDRIGKRNTLFVAAVLKHLCTWHGLEAVKVVEDADLSKALWLDEEK